LQGIRHRFSSKIRATCQICANRLARRYLGAMTVVLGDQLSAAIFEPDGRDRGRFATALTDLGHRADRAELMGHYVAAVAGCREASFGLLDLALHNSSLTSPADSFRNLLDRARWSVQEIREALLRSALFAGILAICFEIHVGARADGSGRDLIALVAVGAGWSIPIGWAHIEHPPVEPGVPDAVRGAVINLIEEFAVAWAALGPGVALPPLLSADCCFGEDTRLRAELAARSVEYVLPVPAEFDEAVPVTHPYESSERGRTLAELLPWAPDRPPAMVELASAQRREAEYVAPLSPRQRLLIHPEVELPAGAILGHHPQQRVLELAELRAPEPGLIESLRVAGFGHPSARAVIRHAWLMSILSVFLRGRLAEEDAGS
jgi:hypothetical protein